MSASAVARPGAPMPPLTVPLVGGGTRSFGPDETGWAMLVVYRGRHCPRCKTYLGRLNGLLDGFEGRGVTVTATSADPEDRAQEDRLEFGWRFGLGHSLAEDDMRALGLYVSDLRSEAETDRPFAEPGVFVVNAEGLVHVLCVSNAAAARPDLEALLDGIAGIQDRTLPIRGLRGLG